MPYDPEKASDVTKVQDKLKKTYKNVSDTAARQAIHVFNSIMDEHNDEGRAWAGVYSTMNKRDLTKKSSSLVEIPIPDRLPSHRLRDVERLRKGLQEDTRRDGGLLRWKTGGFTEEDPRLHEKMDSVIRKTLDVIQDVQEELEGALKSMYPLTDGEIQDLEKALGKALKHLGTLRGLAKTGSNLRAKTIRLAAANPDLRPHLLPLLKDAHSSGPYADYEVDLLKVDRELKDVLQTLGNIETALDGATTLSGPLRDIERAYRTWAQWLRKAL